MTLVLEEEKIVSFEDLEELVLSLREKGKKIATLNGSFDLLHAGHLHILREAKKRCDVLIVLLNSDESIQRYKSLDRPIIPLKYRLELMASIGCVDYVSSFGEDDPRKILTLIKPDVHINGAEYGSSCIEAETVGKYGGHIHLVNRIEGLSTTQIIDKIKKL